MNGLSILERHDAQIFSELGDVSPGAYATVWLYFLPDRMADNLSTPSFEDIWPFAQYLFPKIPRRFHD